MGLWKAARDKIVSDRLIDEELHALAYKEIESGVRRDGLWTKAVLKGGGDAARTKLAYLRLLVQRLKDDYYADVRGSEDQASRQKEQRASRAREEAKAQEAEQARQATQRAHRDHIKKLCASIKRGHLEFYGYLALAEEIGANLKAEGSIFNGYYSFEKDEQVRTFRDIRFLRPWYLENVIPLIEEKSRKGC